MELDYFGWVASLGKLLDPLGFDWKSLMSDSTFTAHLHSTAAAAAYDVLTRA
jgi:hypothetical protein